MSRPTPPRPGDLYAHSNGRNVEILAVEPLAEEDALGDIDEVNAVAWRYIGGTFVHLTTLSHAKSWHRLPGGTL